MSDDLHPFAAPPPTDDSALNHGIMEWCRHTRSLELLAIHPCVTYVTTLTQVGTQREREREREKEREKKCVSPLLFVVLGIDLSVARSGVGQAAGEAFEGGGGRGAPRRRDAALPPHAPGTRHPQDGQTHLLTGTHTHTHAHTHTHTHADRQTDRQTESEMGGFMCLLCLVVVGCTCGWISATTWR